MRITRSLTFLLSSLLASSCFAATLVDLSQNDFKEQKSRAYQLTLLKKTTDKAGNVHTRYEQTYDGVPVFGYHVIKHDYAPTFKSSGISLKAYSGTAVQGLEADLPSMRVASSSDPQQVLEDLKIRYADDQGLPFDRLVYENEVARSVIFIDDNQTAHMAYEVHFYVDSMEGGIPSRPHYLVEAETGQILKQWEGLTSERIGQGPGGNQRIGYYTYGKDRPALDIDKTRGRCSLDGEGGKTVHMNNRYADSKSAFGYNCRRSMIQDHDATNGAASPLNDAHYFIDVLNEFYLSRYHSAPLPFPLVMRAHYGRNFANAFWNGSSMTYGDGNQDLYPFVVLDIAAHEIAHGVTENNANLIYQSQSGGINEAFSDMASRAIEYHVFGVHDWYLGGGIFKDPKVLGLRYMDNPTQDGRSIDHASDYYEGLDVHLSSGVYNKAFYLLATTPGWNTGLAFDMMYSANTAYWQPSSNYAQAAWGVIQATAAHGANVDDVINAFKQVGIQCDKESAKCS